MGAEWYCRIGQSVHGPMPAERLKRLAEAGKLKSTDLVKKGNDGNWLPASHVKGLTFPSPQQTSSAKGPPRSSAPPGADSQHASSQTESDGPAKNQARQLPGWCKAVLYFDLVWSWLVLAFVGYAEFAPRPSGTVLVMMKDWTGLALFVTLVATVANLRLLKGQRSGLWVAYLALALTVLEQWLRADENRSPAGLFWALAVGSVAYDSVYLLAILRVRAHSAANRVPDVRAESG